MIFIVELLELVFLQCVAETVHSGYWTCRGIRYNEPASRQSPVLLFQWTKFFVAQVAVEG